MRKTTPKQGINQILILSKLSEGPKRFMELRNELKDEIRSDDTFSTSLQALEAKRIIKREKRRRKLVIYSLNEESEKEHRAELSIARFISLLGRTEFISECMQILVHDEDISSIFSSKEEAVQAAVDFWVERYRNLCVLTALFSLYDKSHNSVDGESVLHLRRLYRTVEDKYFDIILRFSRKEPDVRMILDKKLSLKGINLKPSWMSARLDEFLKTHYSDAHKNLGDQRRARIFFALRAKERSTERIQCLKKRTEYPRWICTALLCKYFKPSINKNHCRYGRV